MAAHVVARRDLLRRRDLGDAPVTRQDIADEALRDWFRKHGYAR